MKIYFFNRTRRKEGEGWTELTLLYWCCHNCSARFKWLSPSLFTCCTFVTLNVGHRGARHLMDRMCACMYTTLRPSPPCTCTRLHFDSVPGIQCRRWTQQWIVSHCWRHESSWCNGCSLFVQYFVKTCINEWVWLHIHTWACLNWWPINAGSRKMLNMCRLSSSFCYYTIFCLMPLRSTDIFFFCTISKLTLKLNPFLHCCYCRSKRRATGLWCQLFWCDIEVVSVANKQINKYTELTS